MALNLKNQEVDRLAAEVAAMTKESKTEAVRKALLERKARLSATPRAQKRSERVAGMLQAFHDALPPGVRGKRLTRAEEDEILGFGPNGV